MQRQTHSCPGPMGRRDFLRLGCLSLSGLCLGDLVRARAELGTAQAVNDTACIFVWLGGGPSHLETYDMKPNAPEEYRGPFKPIRTRVAGMDICEMLPRQAELADKFSLIRSCGHGFFGHQDGAQQVLTGREPKRRATDDSDYPDLGAIYKRARKPLRQGMPHYVAIPRQFEYGGPAYLGHTYEPFAVSGNLTERGFRVRNFDLSPQSRSVMDQRMDLLKEFDRLRRDVDNSGLMDAMDANNQEAVRLLTGDAARKAFDLSLVAPRDRDRYGETIAGQSLFLARRLVEHGVGFVSVDLRAFPEGGGKASNWDDHAVNWHIFDEMKRRLPIFDQAVATLIRDVYERGLDKKVLVVVTGEFGRTPKIEDQNNSGRPGRDHYAPAMSILVSGGGMRMGQVIGSTDAKGEWPNNRKLHPTDVLATFYKFLGIDPKQEFFDHTGRPLPILPSGEPIQELLG